MILDSFQENIDISDTDNFNYTYIPAYNDLKKLIEINIDKRKYVDRIILEIEKEAREKNKRKEIYKNYNFFQKIYRFLFCLNKY